MKKIFIAVLSLVFVSCQNRQEKNVAKDQISIDSLAETGFNLEIDAKAVKLVKIENGKLSATITNYGARLVTLFVPDAQGIAKDIILGYDSIKEFKSNSANFYGAIVGRYGNRIGSARFNLGDETYELEKNDGENSLHGGQNGFYNKMWDIKNQTDTSVTLTYTSADLEAGYPGNLDVEVTYTLTSTNGLEIKYSGQTDKETVVNLTNHAYFNLNGAGDSTILDHELQIAANQFTEVNSYLIPTGNQIDVAGTAFDFRDSKPIGLDIARDEEQLEIGKGYDHNFVLDKDTEFAKIAKLYAPRTGIIMEVWTTEPGLQFYSGNFMSDQDAAGKGGKRYGYRSALCLETQHFPDSPNQPNFPSTVLKPGDTYNSKTTYYFSTKK
ncbi:aldose epimerase family protein [Sphingobacterium lactis]|uniref:aldose epimerase family protein n=1 Tax=Sphingobacterium lactis TaxID=797291 RepID=UPI003EC68241